MKNRAQYHVLKTHGNLDYMCGSCGFSSPNRAKVGKHGKSHKDKEIKIVIECKFCDFKASENRMAAHLSINHEDDLLCDAKELLKCTLCDFEHTSQRLLSTHVGKEHALWICEHCEEQFTNKRHLEGHVRKSHQQSTYDCQKCDFKTKHQSALHRHDENMHKEVKLFNYKECGHEFARKDNMLAHGRKVHNWTC